MTKRGWRTVALSDLALVGGPVVIAGILARNGWNLGSLRLALLAVFGVELILILLSGWYGILTTRVRGASYGYLGAPATDEIFTGPDPEDVRRGSWLRQDPIAIGPGVAAVLLLLSFTVLH